MRFSRAGKRIGFAGGEQPDWRGGLTVEREIVTGTESLMGRRNFYFQNENVKRHGHSEIHGIEVVSFAAGKTSGESSVSQPFEMIELT
jgi:hypothetical protein